MILRECRCGHGRCTRPERPQIIWRRLMKIKSPIYPSRKFPLPFFLFSVALLSLTALTARAQTQTDTATIVQDPANGAALALPSPTPVCERTIKADVVALDQVIMFNRLGAVNPNGMIYALKKDVVAIDPLKGIVAGNVRLRDDKRPRPIVLRMNSGDCLRITFTNLLSSTPLSDQPATRSAGIHVAGMELVGSIASDGSNVGNNAPSLVAPGGSTKLGALLPTFDPSEAIEPTSSIPAT